MRCPYCISEIDDAAVACPHCTRDLYLFKPLLQRIAELEARVATLETKGGAALGETSVSESFQIEPDTPQSVGVRELALRVGVPLALLLLMHVLLTVVYDAPTAYLRVISLLIPLPFGFLLTAHSARRMFALVMSALSVSLLAVFGMSLVTALVDSVPVLPANLREWRELLEYAASVGFSYATGTVLGNMARRRGRQIRQQAGMSVALAKLVSSGTDSTQRFHKAVTKFNDFGGALTAAGTTVMSVYMGRQGLLK